MATLAVVAAALMQLAFGMPYAERQSPPASTALSTTSAAADESADGEVLFEVAERHSFVLGGESGRYTEWKRYGLDTFDGLAATVDIGDVFVKRRDKWAPIARINLFGDGDEKTRPLLSLIFQHDLKTKKRWVIVSLNRDEQVERVDFQLDPGKFTLKILAIEPGKLRVIIDDKRQFDMLCAFEITGVGLLGSGLDVTFDPLELLRRKVVAPDSARREAPPASDAHAH